MNGHDKQDLNVILEKMEQADKDRVVMHTDIKFIKENLFNPHEGLWAETKLNSQFLYKLDHFHDILALESDDIIIENTNSFYLNPDHIEIINENIKLTKRTFTLFLESGVTCGDSGSRLRAPGGTYARENRPNTDSRTRSEVGRTPSGGDASFRPRSAPATIRKTFLRIKFAARDSSSPKNPSGSTKKPVEWPPLRVVCHSPTHSGQV